MEAIERWWQTVLAITDALDQMPVAYCIVEDAALVAQGVVSTTLPPITVFVQWDRFPDVYGRFQAFRPTPIDERGTTATFRFPHDDYPVVIACRRNTVVAADPHRVPVEHGDRTLWATSLLFLKRRWPADDPRVAQIREHLRTLQDALTTAHAAAWNELAYEAWIERHGSPHELAARIRRDPEARLTEIEGALGDVRDLKIANLLGSYGGKAVALALLGAQVTVVDIAPANARYAGELAAAAGVSLRYIVADVLALPPAECSNDYDLVVMEQGILHYFIDLEPLAEVVAHLLRRDGRLVLHEFHPISTKLITSKGRKHKVTGNYFSADLHETAVAYAKHLGSAPEDVRVRLRRWTLGETVTAFAAAGLCVRELIEEPNTKLDDAGLPKTFTLIAEKRSPAP